METKIKFYKERLAVNFLAKDIENAKEINEAIDSYTAIGALSKDFDSIEAGIEYVTELNKAIPSVSVGLGAGDPTQFEKAALIGAATDSAHVNQVFTGAGFAAGALRQANCKGNLINVLISPTGTVGKVKISTGERSAKQTDAIVDVDTAMAMVLDMKAHSIKFFPMQGLTSIKELEEVAKACVRVGVKMIEPTGGITLENFKEITKVCLDTGVEKIMPHIYGSVIDKETGVTRVEDVKKVYAMMQELL